MLAYIRAERIKVKHTFISKIPFAAPLVTVLLAILLAANYCQVDSYNWWYVTILPGMISLICALYADLEEKHNGRAVLGLPLSLKKVWRAKVIVLLEKLVISSVILSVGAKLSELVWQDKLLHLTFSNVALACVLLIVTTMWQLPLGLWLKNKIGLFPMVILNMILNIIFSVTISLTPKWIFVPYAYPARLMCSVLKILPNGLQAVPGSVTFKPELLSYEGIVPAVIISIILFIGLTLLTEKTFERKEAN